MASLKDIRVRIESTKNTQQITKAMKLVSAAKLRRAQNQIVSMRPYATTLLKVVADVAATERVTHPLMEKHPEVKRVLLVVITSDRGLCGGFNGNINKFAENYYKTNVSKYEAIDFMFIGKRGADYFARRNLAGKEVITKLDKDVSYGLATGVADKLMKYYLDGQYDEIRLIYNEFKSAISQNVTSETILPIDVSNVTFETGDSSTNFSTDMIYEPEPAKIIEELLYKVFNIQVFRAMSESVAAEHGARMTAMENASNNAKEVLARLTLTYNKVRQEKITTELVEIVSGAEALK